MEKPANLVAKNSRLTKLKQDMSRFKKSVGLLLYDQFSHGLPQAIEGKWEHGEELPNHLNSGVNPVA